MAKTKTFYPSIIKPDYSTRQPPVSNATGCKAVHQAMKGANNLKSDNSNVASWGDRFPDKTHSRNPARYYPNTITSFVGTWNTPSPFSVTEWNIPDDIDNNCVVKKVTLEYAIYSVKYTNQHVKNAGYAYNSDGCKFYVNEVVHTGAGDVRAESGGKARNCASNYLITFKFDGTKNFPGQGLEYKKITTQNLDTYATMPQYSTVLYNSNNSNKELTINQLKKAPLRFILPRNLNWDIGRIVMKYVRLAVQYEEIEPEYKIESLKVSKDTIKNIPEDKSKVTVKIRTTNGYTDDVQVKLSGNGITSARAITNVSDKNFKNNIWTVKSFDKNGTATLTFDVSYSTIGKKNITATVQKSSLTTSIIVESLKPSFDFIAVEAYNDEPSNIYMDVNHKIELNDYDEETGFFKIIFDRHTTSNKDYFILESDGLDLDFSKYNTGIKVVSIGNYQWKISSEKSSFNVFAKCKFNLAGMYLVTASYTNPTYSSYNKSISYEINIKSRKDEDGLLNKDYFKLRLEDGSDVKYNSLMFTKGDDLKIPLTYTMEDSNTYMDNILITGERKHVPTNEIHYIQFNIEMDNKHYYCKECQTSGLGNYDKCPQCNSDKIQNFVDDDIELKDVITYIEAIDNEKKCNDIIVGSSKNVKLIDNDDNEKICIIDSIKTGETTIIKLAVRSTDINECYIYIKPYNVNEPYSYLKNNPHRWTPAYVLFKDIPNIKIWIEGEDDINTSEEGDDKFYLNYYIQNLSDVAGENLRFQIKEPHNFEKCEYELKIIDTGQNTNSQPQPTFDKDSRIVTFPILNPQNINVKYELKIGYKPLQKGIYNFIIHTIDNSLDMSDDQYKNYAEHQVLVDIPNEIKASTIVSKKNPYVNELIDFTINVKNKFKKQKEFSFEIYDIGRYDLHHSENHYEVQPYVICDKGKFVPCTKNNMIGKWVLDNIQPNTKHSLNITLNPIQSGVHVIKTILRDNNNEQIQDFENKVQILERKKQIDFNVYHAISEDEDDDCSNCNELIPICDKDFINLKDKIYYVFDVANNNKNPIDDEIHVYARLPESFLTNGILCNSKNVMYTVDNNSNLIDFKIFGLKGCKDKDKSKIKFCIKIEPNQIGDFISNFSLSTKNAKVLTKQLRLTVDTEFNERKLEHEINIYNFEKTNKYYRYEIDNNGEIFKFFNKGDKSVRLIDHEKHNQSSLETYRGTNLRRLVREIKAKSKYVDPVFLREGSNKLTDRGYEIYPDGLIRRFGLLKSEVFHYSNQIPVTSNLVERAMKWDIDTWDTKVWGGDIYDNGVFDLTIDYSKVPSNFDILDVNNPIKNLQALVDNAKPYGTQAICYYSAVVNLKLRMFINSIKSTQGYTDILNLKLKNKLGIISEYDKNDSTLDIYYDMIRMGLNAHINNISTYIDNNIYNDIDSDSATFTPNIKTVDTVAYTKHTDKIYTKDCYDIISNIYSTREKNNNIDILKEYNYDDFKEFQESTLLPQQIINFVNNLSDNQVVGFEINTENIYIYNPNKNITPDKIFFKFERNDINYFNGFKITAEDDTIEEYNITDQAIEKVSMQIEKCEYNGYKVLHFWGSINDEDYYHIGHILITTIADPIIKLINDTPVDRYQCEKEKKLTFQLSNRNNIITQDVDYIESIEQKNKWQRLYNVTKKNNKYAYFANTIDIDPECDKENYKINVPKLIFKYNNINIDETDEVVDIAFKVKAQTNKENFADEININAYKDGDAYIPNNNIAKKIYYPDYIKNDSQELLETIKLEQPNITVCADCMKTDLGYYEECQYCGSKNVYHTNEKTPATVCHNCNYIAKGWNDYCTHCLSYDVDKIKIDYNKTYCQDCYNIADDYYTHCPHCFSSHVIHLTNDKKVYRLFNEEKQNIDPINIHINEKRVNIFNLEIPFSNKTKEISKDVLEYLNLKVHGTNHNNGIYYYCDSCKIGGLGHYNKCPHCGSNTVHNKTINQYTIDIYYQDAKEMQHLGIEKIDKKFNTQIELQDISLHNQYDSFLLLFYIENECYDAIIEEITQLPIKDKYQEKIISALTTMNITIDNLSLDYKYKKQDEWQGLNNIYGKNHTGITYNIPYNKKVTDNIVFSGFNIPYRPHQDVNLHLHGIVKDINNYRIHFTIVNNKKIYNYTTEILFNDVFNYKLNVSSIVNDINEDIEIKVAFIECNENGKVTILSCDLLSEYEQNKKIIHDNINDISTKVNKESDYYLLSSLNNNIWGLNDTKPGYLSGKQLETNLICYIDFGHLNLNEYIRLYDIEMILLYKNKIGQIATENIPIEEIENSDTLNQLTTNDAYYSEQNINGSIKHWNGEAWLSLKYPVEILNNLEYEVNTNNDDDEILNSIPLYDKIAQSFILESTEINKISIVYYKNRGYPNSIINVYLCRDDNNKPGVAIESKKIQIELDSNIIDIDFNVNDLTYKGKYWIVIEDKYTDKYNYHQFSYNTNTHKGQLIRYKNDDVIYDNNRVLSFSIDTNYNMLSAYELPIFWSVPYVDDYIGYENDTEDVEYDIYTNEMEYDTYKMCMTFYRYNIQTYSNISASNLHINYGYQIKEEDENNEDEGTI